MVSGIPLKVGIGLAKIDFLAFLWHSLVIFGTYTYLLFLFSLDFIFLSLTLLKEKNIGGESNLSIKWYFSYIFNYIDNIFLFPEWKWPILISITNKWTIFFRNTSPQNGKFLEWVKCSGLECCHIWYVFIGHK